MHVIDAYMYMLYTYIHSNPVVTIRKDKKLLGLWNTRSTHVFNIAVTSYLPLLTQGRRKQSPDGQAQLDVGGEAVNNSRTKSGAWYF